MAHPPDNNTSPRSKIFDKRQLATLVDMYSTEAVHKEVVHILGLINPQFDIEPVNTVFNFTVALYEGRMQGYRACNTEYHNLRHITDTYLAMARMLHGAQLSGENFSDREIFLSLTAILMHDTGMIQESHDTEGTGAKYTPEHVMFSMDFVAKHAEAFHFSSPEIADMRNMILCTDLQADIPAIDFSGPRIELLGKILATADLIAQMADRTYLEKLLFLFCEFHEAKVGNYKNEIDFMHQTLDFFKFSTKRFKETLDDTSRYMTPHFESRWGIAENLYTLSLEKHRNFLEKTLQDKNVSLYRALKRDKLAQKALSKWGDILQKED